MKQTLTQGDKKKEIWLVIKQLQKLAKKIPINEKHCSYLKGIWNNYSINMIDSGPNNMFNHGNSSLKIL